MDTRLLRMFCAVVRHGSLAAAGRELRLTPSAISHALKSLETHVGCQLLDRVGKRVLLNASGEQLLAQIQEPLAALERATENLQQLGQSRQRRLRLGAAASMCECILPPVIRELKKIYPDLLLQVESGDMPVVVDLLERNKIDLALGVAPDQTPGLQVRQLFRDELLLTMAPAHPWVTARAIPRADIPHQSLLLYQHASLTAQLVNEHFRAEGQMPMNIMEIGSIPAIKELVKLNVGVAILAPWTCAHELKQRTLHMRPLGASPLSRSWCMVSLAGREFNEIEETFLRLCRKHVTSIRTDRRDLPRSNRRMG